MAILGSHILKKGRPYIEFVVVDSPFDEIWPEPSKYERDVFIDFADVLLDLLCRMIQNYAFFDKYEFIQLKSPPEIYNFTAQLLTWETQLAKTPVNYFDREIKYISGWLENENYTCEQFKADLLETLHFMVGEMHKAAASGRCVVIAGF
jgi:hypothetical protein